MNNRRKEVFFDMYCKTCKYYKQASYLHPCNDCLNTPYNEDSHKPVNWKEGEKNGQEAHLPRPCHYCVLGRR